MGVARTRVHGGVTVSAGAASGGQGRAAGTLCQVCNSVIHQTVIIVDLRKPIPDKEKTTVGSGSGQNAGVQADRQNPTPIVLLAAGSGSRFGGANHKLTTVVAGRPVAAWAIEAALEAHVGPLVIVTGAITVAIPDDLGSTARASIDAFGPPRVVDNPSWAEGMATSIQAGLARCDGATAVVVGLADQPCVTPEAYRCVAESTSPLAIATYEGVRGNPVRVHAELWPMLPRTGDEGARVLFRSHAEYVQEVPCSGSAIDVDTQADVSRVEACLAARKRKP